MVLLAIVDKENIGSHRLRRQAFGVLLNPLPAKRSGADRLRCVGFSLLER